MAFNNGTLRTAVAEWIADPAAAMRTYGHISTWDVSHVTSFSELFKDKESFNEDISSWDVSNGQYFGEMFSGAKRFNHYIGAWDVAEYADFKRMFEEATKMLSMGFIPTPTADDFNKPRLTDLNIKKAVNQGDYSFTGPYGPIEHWDVSQVTDFSKLFENKTNFNEDISRWDVSGAYIFTQMFQGATSFNQDIGEWDVGDGAYFNGMFSGATSFNNNIGIWDVSKGTNFSRMFYNAKSFNHYIGAWDVAEYADFSKMFEEATKMLSMGFIPTPTADDFNKTRLYRYNIKEAVNQGDYSFTGPYGPIEHWDVSQVTDFSKLFENKTNFNEDISRWDVSGAYIFTQMFQGATSFNQDIGEWDVGDGAYFSAMFENATSFNQDISSWNLRRLTVGEGMFRGSTNFPGMFFVDANGDVEASTWKNLQDFTKMIKNIALSPVSGYTWVLKKLN